MYCPKCGADFVEGVTVCSDCGIELTPEPPTEPEAKYVEWVTVFGSRHEGDVRLAESIVRGASIECVIEGDETQFAGVADPVRLCVRPADVERATELLKELLEGEAKD